MHVVHEAAAPSFRVIREPFELRRVRERYGLADRFILYVGTIEPRKNLPTLDRGIRARGDPPATCRINSCARAPTAGCRATSKP